MISKGFQHYFRHLPWQINSIFVIACSFRALFCPPVPSPQHHFIRLPPQLGAEVGVGDGDQAVHPLAEIGTPQAGHAVLRHDAVHPVAGDGHHRAQGQGGPDLGHRAVPGGGGNDHDAPPSPGHIGPRREVHGAAGAGILMAVQRLGANLTGQVDLQSGVDGHHVVVLGDVIGVVHIGRGQQLDVRIAVDELIKRLVAPDEAADGLAGVKVLAPVGDHAALHEPSGGGAEDLGIDAQIVLVVQGVRHGVGQVAQADLDGVAVPHQGSGVGCRLPLRLRGGELRWMGHGAVGFDQAVHLADVDFPARQQQRHMGVDLKDTDPGGGKGVVLDLHHRRKVEIPLFVHGRHRRGKHVRLGVGNAAAQLMQVGRYIADAAISVVGPGLGVIKNAVDEKAAAIGGIGEKGIALLGDAGPHGHVPHPRCDGVQRAVQQHRLTGVGTADDGAAAVDEGQGVRHGAQFFLIELMGRHR